MFLETAAVAVQSCAVIMTSIVGCCDSLFGELDTHRAGALSYRKTGVIILGRGLGCKRKMGENWVFIFVVIDV